MRSVALANLERKTSISLQQCLSSLVKDEELTLYCRECSKKAGEFTEPRTQHQICPSKDRSLNIACIKLLNDIYVYNNNSNNNNNNSRIDM